MTSLLRKVRPLEWGCAAFLLFVLIRVGPAVFLEWRELAGLRTVTVFFTLGMVGAILLARDFASLPWPVGTASMRRVLWLSLPLTLAPFLLAAFIALTTRSLGEQLSHARPAQAIAVLATVFLRVVGFGLPTFLIWLAVGQQMKRLGRLDSRRLILEDGRKLLAALREWAPLLLVLSAYAWMDAVVGGKLGEERDLLMQSIDRAMFAGTDPLDLLARIIWPPLSEWLAFAYSFYAVLYPLVFGAILLFAGRAALRETSFLVGAALLLSYASYSLIPVKGPLLVRTFDVSLELYLIGPVKEALMDATRITWDCFPSMHTCCTLLLGYSAYRHVRRLFWWILPIVVSMPFACVYLRYHYVIDVLVGIVLAVVMALVVKRFRAGIVGDAAENAP